MVDDGESSVSSGDVRWPTHSQRSSLADLSLEALVSLVTAGLFTASCTTIRINPLERMGQVSGLASIGLRFTLVSIILIAWMAWAARSHGGAHFELTKRLACAAVAGLWSGFFAAGIMLALQGTPWCLFADQGDAGNLQGWAARIEAGRYPAQTYPPLPAYALWAYAKLAQLPYGFAMKHLQILGALAFGPMAYVSWRLLLSPLPALALGVVAALPLLDAYKPYGNLALVSFVPVLVLFVEQLRTAGARSRSRLVVLGLLFGTFFGLQGITYSAWLMWSSLGCIAVAFWALPNPKAARAALPLLGTSAAVFFSITASYLYRTFKHGITDPYQDFDAFVEPAYVAMSLRDLPGGITGPWPPLGELGGVGLFTVLLAVGFATAIALARQRTLVMTVSLILSSAWLCRFFLAQRMADTGLVQLFPRSLNQILYCLLILSGYAAYLLIGRAVTALASSSQKAAREVAIGALCGLLLLLGSASSATANRYMPDKTKRSLGWLAWIAHTKKDLVSR